jgi:putative acyl-CoA dehydrogenase
VAHRNAFGSPLIDKPLMQNVLADLEIETETATLMMVRLAGAFDRAEFDADEAAFRRIALPIAKYWLTKQTTAVVREAMECLGGNGYVEESILPRLFRESPLNAIWEGSGNVIALDFLRAANREPAALETFFADLEANTAGNKTLDDAVTRAREAASGVQDPEADARRIVEAFALAWAGTLCARHEDDELLGAFAASRLDERHGMQYGTLEPGLPLDVLSRRTVPRF